MSSFRVEAVGDDVDSDLPFQVRLSDKLRSTMRVSAETLAGPVTVHGEAAAGEPFSSPERLSLAVARKRARRQATAAAAAAPDHSVISNNSASARVQPEAATAAGAAAAAASAKPPGAAGPAAKAGHARPKYLYTPLMNLVRASSASKELNCYGIVTYSTPPKATRGTDHMCTIKLVDPSWSLDDEGIPFNFFAQDEADLPAVQGVGEIMRLHRVRIQVYNGKPQGVCKIRPSDGRGCVARGQYRRRREKGKGTTKQRHDGDIGLLATGLRQQPLRHI